MDDIITYNQELDGSITKTTLHTLDKEEFDGEIFLLKQRFNDAKARQVSPAQQKAVDDTIANYDAQIKLLGG